MAAQSTPRYAFDQTARLAANLITNERHTLTPKNGYDFHYIIPDYAPFYVRDLKVYKLTQQGAKQFLVEGVDYKLGYEFLQAVNSTGVPVYGAISFINRNLAGDVYLEYRTVGGDWLISPNKIAEIIADLQYNPVYTTWEQVANIPYQFPPSSHSHDVADMTSWGDLLTVLRELGERVGASDNTRLQKMIADVVERTMRSSGKAAIGLDKLRNLDILPLNNGNNNTDNYYVTPRGVRDIINTIAMPVINDHINARGNVHGLTAADIGAVTSDEITRRLNTKLGKSEQAADSLLFDGRDSQQVKSFVLDGTSANTAKFNGLTYTEMVEDVKNRLNAILQAATGDQAANLPAKVLQLTAGNANKFGGLTPEQFTTKLLATSTIDAATLNGLDKDAIINAAKANVNATLLNGKTSQQIINESKQNVNATQLGGKTLQQVVADARTNVNATQLSGLTKDQIVSEAKVNVNAIQLGGKTSQQIIEEARRSTNATSIGGKSVDTFKQELVQSIKAATTTIGGYTVRQIIDEARLDVNAKTLDGLNKESLRNYVLSASNISAATLGGKTADQIISDAKQNVNAAQLGGRSLQQVISDAKTNVDATQLNGKSAQQIIDEAKRNVTAVNSAKLEGKSYATIRSEISSDINENQDNSKVHMGSGINQHPVTTTGSTKQNVVKIGKSKSSHALPAVTIDQTDMGNMFLYRKGLTSESINSLKNTADVGIYSQSSDTNATTALGYPVAKNGTLMVMPSYYTVQQWYFTREGSAIYARQVNTNDTWSSWVRIDLDPSKMSNSISGADANKLATEKAVGDLHREVIRLINTAKQQAVAEVKEYLFDSRTNKFKEEHVPAPKWQ